MKIFFIFIYLLTGTAGFASIPKEDWVVKTGKLTYHVHFAIKNVEGVTETVKGKGHCDKTNCDFLIAAPVKSFDSGDGNRDNHMIEVTKAAMNPMVMVKVQLPKNIDLTDLKANLEITFGGETHTYKDVKVAVASSGTTRIKGTIPMNLSDFHIERPALFSVPIDDKVPVDFDLVWE